MERTAAQFRVLVGDAGRATQLLNDLRQFDIEAPLSLTAILDASKVLLQFGVNVEQVAPMLRQLGDVSLGNVDNFGRLALAMAQVSAAGKLQGQDLLQLVNAGWNPLQTIAGLTGETLTQVRERMSQGAVSASEVANALKVATSEGGRFAGMMATSAQTVAGRWDVMLGKLTALGTSIGTVVLPAAGMLVDGLTRLVDLLGALDGQLVMNVAKLTAFGVAFTATLIYGPRVVAMLGSIVTALRGMATAQAILTAITGPKGLMQLIASLAVASATVVGLNAVFEQSAQAAQKSADASTGAAVAAQKAAAATTAVGSATTQSATLAADALGKLSEKWSDVLQGVQAHNDLLERGQQIAQQVRTPTEVFGDTVRELQALVASGAIDGETYARAFAKASDELAKAKQESDGLRESIEGLGAAVVGTSRGFEAIAKARRETFAQRDEFAQRERVKREAMAQIEQPKQERSAAVDMRPAQRLESLAERIERAQRGVGLGVRRDQPEQRTRTNAATGQTVAVRPATDPRLLAVLDKSETHLAELVEQQRRAKPVKVASVELY